METCERCNKAVEAKQLDDFLECGDCQEARNERAYEASLSHYYGASTPQTEREIQLATWAQKEGR